MNKIADISHVRLGAPDDEADLLDMVRAMHEESSLRTQGRPLVFSDAKARGVVRNALYREEGGACSWVGIIGARGQLEGSLCLSIVEPSPFSHEQFLEALWHYVLPKYRGSHNSSSLLVFAQRVSDTLGIPLLLTEDVWHVRGKKTFCERMLGQRAARAVFMYSSPQADSLGAGA